MTIISKADDNFHKLHEIKENKKKKKKRKGIKEKENTHKLRTLGINCLLVYYHVVHVLLPVEKQGYLHL